MKCSVIVPVYNMAGDGKLEYCLNSLIHQTLKDLEIIAVDDASTDNSLEILRQYEMDYPERFKVIHYIQNKRQGGAKNEGLKVATGEWIGFIDSDDWVTPDFYEKLIGKAEEKRRKIQYACQNIYYKAFGRPFGFALYYVYYNQRNKCYKAKYAKYYAYGIPYRVFRARAKRRHQTPHPETHKTQRPNSRKPQRDCRSIYGAIFFYGAFKHQAKTG